MGIFGSKCPNCGSTDYIPIVYGLPTSEGFDQDEKGEIILGGCCVFPNSKKKCCKKCRTRY